MRLRISDRSVLCIDWDERSLRVLDARFSSRSGVRIRGALHVPLAPGTDVRDPASVGGFLRQALGEHRIRTRRAIVDIPRQDAVLNLLPLPEASTDELAAMVHIQIAKELPFSKEQAVIDFAVAREQGANTCDVWVSAVRSHVIDHYQQVIRAAGLKLERIGLRPYANLAALTVDDVPAGRTLTVDIGPAMTEINVIRDGRLAYSRAASVSVPVGGLSAPIGPAGAPGPSSTDDAGDATLVLADDSPAQPGPMDALLIEVSRTIEAYRATDPGSTIDRIVLSGTAEIDREVQEAFEERFGSPTTTYEAPSSLRWRPKGQVSAAPFSAVIGLAMSNAAEGTLRFDFLHPKEPEAGRRERAKRVPMMAATVALFVAAAGVAAYQPFRSGNARLTALQNKIDELNLDKEEREAFMKKYEDVMDWKSQSAVWIDHFKRIAEVFPSTKEGYITRLDCDQKGRITVELAATHQKVGTNLAASVEEIKEEVTDESGRARTVRPFEAEVRSTEERRQDPVYKFGDTVIVQVKALKKDK